MRFLAFFKNSVGEAFHLQFEEQFAEFVLIRLDNLQRFHIELDGNIRLDSREEVTHPDIVDMFLNLLAKFALDL